MSGLVLYSRLVLVSRPVLRPFSKGPGLNSEVNLLFLVLVCDWADLEIFNQENDTIITEKIQLLPFYTVIF